MDFDDWMLTKDPKYHPTDDTVTLRRLRECWNDAQKCAVPPAPTFQDGMTDADDRRFLEATSGLDSYELPRCFRCGHLLHAGDCVNVAPHNEKLASRKDSK